MRKSILFIVSALILLTSCNDPVAEQGINDPMYDFSGHTIKNNRLRIKFSKVPTIGADEMAQLGILSMQRTFPHAGKFEERTRREGLHLWYDLVFSEDRSRTRATSDLSAIEGIEVISPVRKIVSRSTNYPFNDPFLPRLWGLHNPGTESWQEAGSDIRLFDVWKQYNGHPDIIIALVDGGIALEHPDLQDNLWINPGEVDGNGVDDDENGYVDDVYGYNFVSMTSKITPNRHGTHVAGTIAATNNNGVGVSGIAGGDGTPNSGVKLMNCQIFEHPNGIYTFEVVAYNTPAAIKYGADNGAVISQNSWGYAADEDEPAYTINVDPADKAAIDYFVKYAGCDNDGNQLPGSPMKGGIVLFAAGNASTDDARIAAPADYDKVLGIGAIGWDYKKASYSNYGDYMDIMAPGGVKVNQQGIYSTTLAELGYYEHRNGTSMACPHVAGVAALVIEKYGVGKPGFTATQLQDILLLTAYDLDGYNPEYAGQLGYGCVDATAALSSEPVDNQILVMGSGTENGILSFKVRSDIVGTGVVTIINATGSTVLRKTVRTRRYVYNEVDVSKLAAGYYTFVYQYEDTKVEKKFVKY